MDRPNSVTGMFGMGQPHKRHDSPKPSNPHPWNRLVATCHDHRLQVNWRMEFWDVVPVHGACYLGKARSTREAISKWKNHLISIGVRAEDAEVVDGT